MNPCELPEDSFPEKKWCFVDMQMCKQHCFALVDNVNTKYNFRDKFL